MVTLVVLLAVSVSLVGEYFSQTQSPTPSPALKDNFPPLLSSWDTSLFLWITTDLSNPYIGSALSALTLLGSFSASVILCGFLFLIGQRKRGIVASASIILVMATTMVLKVAVARPRPFMVVSGALPVDVESGSSFPSGHASRVFSILDLTRGRNRRMVLVGYVVAGLVGFSRVYIGVHYPLDVLGGAVLGLISGRVIRRYEGWIVLKVESTMSRLEASYSKFNTPQKQ